MNIFDLVCFASCFVLLGLSLVDGWVAGWVGGYIYGGVDILCGSGERVDE